MSLLHNFELRNQALAFIFNDNVLDIITDNYVNKSKASNFIYNLHFCRLEDQVGEEAKHSLCLHEVHEYVDV